MAISFNNGGSSSRRRAASSISDINVTPFVDVVLVLLIIFMLTAHVMEFGLEIDVPKVKAVRESAKELPVVNLTKDGLVYLNKDQVNVHDLGRVIHERYGANAKGVYVRADKDTVYQPLASVVDELGSDGFQVNLVTQPEDTSARRK
jgi:biopolymer transport protein ExbD